MQHPPFFSSFRYAANGIITALKQERNLRFHLCTGFYVILFSLFYEFTKAEYCVLVLAICGVMAMELVNSALERTVSNPEPARWLTAGVVKDMAAGAVLVFSIGAAVCGVILFWQPSTLIKIGEWFFSRPLMLLLLVASFVVSWVFIFHPKWLFGRIKQKIQDKKGGSF